MQQNFKRKIQEKFANDRWRVNDCSGEYGLYYEDNKSNPEVKEFDIKHTAPQHRHYLSYGGIGVGTPYQREKQFTYYRAAKAVTNINMYRLNKLQDTSEQAIIKKENKRRAKDIKTGLGMDRLVEDLIQESMARGEFDNLSGSGKPLEKKSHENPYVDSVTYKLNQVLIDNGFTPVWILLQKEIHKKKTQVTEILTKERSKLGPNPLPAKEEDIWKNIKTKLKDDVAYLNNRINTYNLMVPILQKQLFLFDLEKESDKILKEGTFREGEFQESGLNNTEKNDTFLGFISSIFQ